MPPSGPSHQRGASPSPEDNGGGGPAGAPKSFEQVRFPVRQGATESVVGGLTAAITSFWSQHDANHLPIIEIGPAESAHVRLVGLQSSGLGELRVQRSRSDPELFGIKYVGDGGAIHLFSEESGQWRRINGTSETLAKFSAYRPGDCIFWPLVGFFELVDFGRTPEYDSRLPKVSVGDHPAAVQLVYSRFSAVPSYRIVSSGEVWYSPGGQQQSREGYLLPKGLKLAAAKAGVLSSRNAPDLVLYDFESPGRADGATGGLKFDTMRGLLSRYRQMLRPGQGISVGEGAYDESGQARHIMVPEEDPSHSRDLVTLIPKVKRGSFFFGHKIAGWQVQVPKDSPARVIIVRPDKGAAGVAPRSSVWVSGTDNAKVIVEERSRSFTIPLPNYGV